MLRARRASPAWRSPRPTWTVSTLSMARSRPMAMTATTTRSSGSTRRRHARRGGRGRPGPGRRPAGRPSRFVAVWDPYGHQGFGGYTGVQHPGRKSGFRRKRGAAGRYCRRQVEGSRCRTYRKHHLLRILRFDNRHLRRECLESPVCAGRLEPGSGVAPIARLAAACIAEETGGSIMMPSAANGGSGIKPSLGTVSIAGLMPLSPGYDVLGPISRSGRDSRSS